ncbi:hypothetical protein GE061_010262 [Apolygus lucorum]|uniref:Uncharacterized protein n=1 Tax=Apolygus lucorum TaxID=248454 RepID=A0A8S9Y2Q7_APOLU|nr:hypothetical protein GE061_010262 [Apolygus lucorum]
MCASSPRPGKVKKIFTMMLQTVREMKRISNHGRHQRTPNYRNPLVESGDVGESSNTAVQCEGGSHLAAVTSHPFCIFPLLAYNSLQKYLRYTDIMGDQEELDYLYSPLEDEVSLAMKALEERTPAKTSSDNQDPESLRIKAVASSEEIITRYLEEIKQKFEESLGAMDSKIADLDNKVTNLVTRAPAAGVPGTSGLTATSYSSILPHEIGQNMEVDVSHEPNTSESPPEISPSTALPPANARSLNSYAHNLFKRPLQRSLGLEESYRARKIDAVRFRTLEKKLENAMFSITAPQNSSPQQQVWVTMGDEEEQHLTTLNYMSEQRGDGTIFQITEGEHESWA